jgi:late embryogenesis abundant protein
MARQVQQSTAVLRETPEEALMKRHLSPANMILLILAGTLLFAACASLSELGGVVRAPRFGQAADRPAELRLLGPSAGPSAGGATVRLWAEVENPNPFGVMLDRLDGTFFLEDRRAARVDFPLGLELGARDNAIVPLDLTIDFDDLSTIADIVRRAVSAREIGYRLEGTVGVDAGPLGNLEFGPMDMLEGELDASVVR